MANKYGITLEEAIDEVTIAAQDAIDFVQSTFEEDWETAERYMNGESDLDETEGRSNVVKTEARDAIRNARPSFMRTLCHARKIVEYEPARVEFGDWSEQQSIYATDLFWRTGGYMTLWNLFEEAAKLKAGILKTYWKENPLPDYFEYTQITGDVLEMIQNNPDMEIEEQEITISDEDNVVYYDISGYHYRKNGVPVMETIPIYEFFIDRNCDNVQDAVERGVHGHVRNMTVAEAIEMGLDYDDWVSLDNGDSADSNFAGAQWAKRRFRRDEPQESEDILRKEIQIVEAYMRFDLKGLGRPQLYRFWFGGTGYEYIDHEEVEDSPFDIGCIDPVPFSPYGRSLMDITIKEQDTNTSILRAVIDNFHASNNPRAAANPVHTNFNDLMNNAIGAPIRHKGPNPIQYTSVPFTGQAGIEVLGYLGQDVQEKVGITKAAQGLDPNAMQSTDKEAVLNTITLSQGQLELMVRNMVETCLIPAFRKLLRLSMRHMDPIQHVRTKGKVIPIIQSYFDPDLVAKPNVGLGTASPEQKLNALMFVLAKQEQAIEVHGMDNPFVSMAQLYNTIEDIVEVSGLPNVGRYFNVITPDVEKRIAQAMKQEQAALMEQQQKAQPADPGKIMLAIESAKARVKQIEVANEAHIKERDLQRQALYDAERVDIERDRLALDRVVQLRKVQAEEKEKQVKQEQAANDK